jgi:hypothetical protein
MNEWMNNIGRKKGRKGDTKKERKWKAKYATTKTWVKHNTQKDAPLTGPFLKPGLDGAWLGSFYVITDVNDKASYSNAPCNRPGAARSVISGERLVGSPQKRFSHDPQRDSARAAVAATRRLQCTHQASLVQPVYT